MRLLGLTRLQHDEIGRERQVQRQGAQRAEARAEMSVELAQARILPTYELGTKGGAQHNENRGWRRTGRVQGRGTGECWRARGEGYGTRDRSWQG